MLMWVRTYTADACQRVSSLVEVRQHASMLENAVAIAVSGAAVFSSFFIVMMDSIIKHTDDHIPLQQDRYDTLLGAHIVNG